MLNFSPRLFSVRIVWSLLNFSHKSHDTAPKKVNLIISIVCPENNMSGMTWSFPKTFFKRLFHWYYHMTHCFAHVTWQNYMPVTMSHPLYHALRWLPTIWVSDSMFEVCEWPLFWVSAVGHWLSDYLMLAVRLSGVLSDCLTVRRQLSDCPTVQRKLSDCLTVRRQLSDCPTVRASSVLFYSIFYSITTNPKPASRCDISCATEG